MSTMVIDRALDVRDVEFFAMVDAGVFGDRRVYLWGGRLMEKMAKTNAHAFLSERVSTAVRSLLPDGWITWHENPIRLGVKTVPLPDFSVIRGPLARYRDARPGPSDTGLIVEIAVTSRAADLGKRAAKYARAGVGCYWVIDAAASEVVEHRRPRVTGGVASYEEVRRYGTGEAIDLILGGQAVGRIPLSEIV